MLALSHDPDPVRAGSAAGAMALCGRPTRFRSMMKQLQDPDAGHR